MPIAWQVNVAEVYFLERNFSKSASSRDPELGILTQESPRKH